MIINLNIHNKKILVIGGGDQAVKRIQNIINEGCKITVISDKVKPYIEKLSRDKKITLLKQQIHDVKLLTIHNPDLIITTTNNHKLNQDVINYAKDNKIMIYSSDDPKSSDYANLSIIHKDTVQIAIYTHGKSPMMAKKLSSKIKKIISDKDINYIKIQEMARKIAKERLATQDRREFLSNIMRDEKIEQLIKDKMLDKAEDRIITILEDMK